MVGKLTPNNLMSASRIPQLLGLSPYATQNQLLSEMIDHDEGKAPEPWEGNELTYWGNVHEGAIITRAAELLGLTDVEVDINEPYFHAKLPLAASLDGRAVGTGIVRNDPSRGIFVRDGEYLQLDGKTVVIEAKSTQAQPEDTPPPWRGPFQLQAQMMCAEADYGIVAVLYRGSELRVWLYQADLATQSNISAAITDFENRRVKKDWYPLANPEDGNVAFRNVDDGAPPLQIIKDFVVQNGDVQDAIEVLVEAKRLKKECEQSIADAETVIKEYMGNHEEARTVVDGTDTIIKWPMRNTRARPEKITPAKPAERVRQNTLTIKELKQ